MKIKSLKKKCNNELAICRIVHLSQNESFQTPFAVAPSNSPGSPPCGPSLASSCATRPTPPAPSLPGATWPWPGPSTRCTTTAWPSGGARTARATDGKTLRGRTPWCPPAPPSCWSSLTALLEVRRNQGLLYHRMCKPDFLCSWPSLNSYLK